MNRTMSRDKRRQMKRLAQDMAIMDFKSDIEKIRWHIIHSNDMKVVRGLNCLMTLVDDTRRKLKNEMN